MYWNTLEIVHAYETSLHHLDILVSVDDKERIRMEGNQEMHSDMWSGQLFYCPKFPVKRVCF